MRRDWQRVPGVRWQVVDANRDAEGWKKVVKQTAAGAMLRERRKPFSGVPLYVSMVFTRARPKSHFNTKGELNAAGLASVAPLSKPDVLKLARAVEDAMSGTVYDDDARIVSETLRKQWGAEEAVEVTVMPL